MKSADLPVHEKNEKEMVEKATNKRQWFLVERQHPKDSPGSERKGKPLRVKESEDGWNPKRGGKL